MDNSSVKKNILTIREGLGLSQEEMADRLEISRNTYRNIEKGRTRLISDTVGKIAELANISSEEVVLGYFPIREETKTLEEERRKMSERMRAMRDEHLAQLEALQKENELLRQALALAEDNCRTKESMIAMLQKQL